MGGSDGGGFEVNDWIVDWVVRGRHNLGELA